MGNNSEHAIAKQLLTTFDGPHHAIGVWRSGSKLNGLASDDSDSDFVVLVEDKPKEILTSTPVSSQRIIHNLGHTYDIKEYSVLQAWRLIRKGNPNLIEPFMVDPLAYDKDDSFVGQFINAKHDILYYDMPRFVKNCLGMENGLHKRYNNGNATLKDFIQTIKNLIYAKQLLTADKPILIHPDVSGVSVTLPNLGKAMTLREIKFLETDISGKAPLNIRHDLVNAVRRLKKEVADELHEQNPVKQTPAEFDQLFYNKVAEELQKGE